MQYLNVLLESLDDENQAYFYGERLVIDYVLLTAIQREVEEVNKRLREEIYRLMNNIVGSLQWYWSAEEDRHDFQIYGYYRLHQ
ncbi:MULTISPECIES: hypothetical protein [Paenibacillus]|uniref:Uncharacterized protein n=1 Tax=Paenibacillus lautus TaxID=1401 RepID=A0A1R1AYW8_PAELA|nr:hypothetical protein [Paenibacillus lautus]OME91296.1 hypothetical protein BK123_17675 [Paenibacillus lautus]